MRSRSPSLTDRGKPAKENDRIPDNAVCALAQLFCHRISLIDNEVLVEDLEDLTPLKTVRHTHDVARSPEEISTDSKYGGAEASSERRKNATLRGNPQICGDVDRRR